MNERTTMSFVRKQFLNTSGLVKWRGLWSGGLDGAPLMRLFKIARICAPVETAAAELRLHTIVVRGQADVSSYVSYPKLLKPDPVQRRFWPPHDLAAADDGA